MCQALISINYHLYKKKITTIMFDDTNKFYYAYQEFQTIGKVIL